MKTEQFDFEIMMADEGGMIINGSGQRSVFERNDRLSRELGEYITAVLIQKCMCDAHVTIKIDMKDGTD